MKQFKRIVVVGDSFAMGHEIAQELVPNSEKHYNKIFNNPTLRINGSIDKFKITDPKNRKMWEDWHRLMEQYDPDWETSRQLAYPGVLASLLGITEYYNFGDPGSSNLASVSRLIDNRHLIDDDTLVIFSITYFTRQTYFDMYGIRSIQFHDSIPEGDDELAAILNLVGAINTAKSIVPEGNLLIVDPMCYYISEQVDKVEWWTIYAERDIEYKLNDIYDEDEVKQHKDIIDYAVNTIIDNVIKATFMRGFVEYTKQNKPYLYLLSHPRKEVHAKLAEDIVTILKDKQ